jgi:pyruvate dehydrogenase E2 component (dihydrolipoamide acetyltransferase)
MVPEVNANLNEKTGEFQRLSSVDISVAVATDKGLITPIVKNANELTVVNIGQQVKVNKLS